MYIKDGTEFDIGNILISDYEKSDRLMLKCRDMAITVSGDLIDMQLKNI